MYTAPRLRELLIDLVSKTSYQLVVNLDKVGFLDSTGLGVLVGGLRRGRGHDGPPGLGCPRGPVLGDFPGRRPDGGFRLYTTLDQAHPGREGDPERSVHQAEDAKEP